jgi:S1-C subfamily serine protease
MLSRATHRLTFAFLTLATLLGNPPSGRAAVPKDLGKSEIRCDDSGCSLGACVTRDMEAEPIRILGKARLIPNITDGQPRGFKLYAIRAGSFLQKLGVQNGDVLLSANSMHLDNPTSALAAYEALRGVEEITLQLDRRGQPISRRVRADRRPVKDGECPPKAPLPETAKAPAMPPATPSPSPSETLRAIEKDIVCTGNSCQLKHGVFDRILDNMTLLQTSARLVPAVKDGQLIGLKLFAIRPGSLFAILLLRNGDLVRKVDGRSIASPEQALETYAKVRNTKSISVELERAGQPLTLTYHVER